MAAEWQKSTALAPARRRDCPPRNKGNLEIYAAEPERTNGQAIVQGFIYMISKHFGTHKELESGSRKAG
jgi:hypothetical protein